jgi:hypothetical protein
MKERKLIAEMQDTIENLQYIIPVKITDDGQIDDRCRVMAKASILFLWLTYPCELLPSLGVHPLPLANLSM